MPRCVLLLLLLLLCYKSLLVRALLRPAYLTVAQHSSNERIHGIPTFGAMLLLLTLLPCACSLDQ